eukprot:3804996-Rhodomonas_salina.1
MHFYIGVTWVTWVTWGGSHTCSLSGRASQAAKRRGSGSSREEARCSMAYSANAFLCWTCPDQTGFERERYRV